MACRRKATGKVQMRSTTVASIEDLRFSWETGLKLHVPNKTFVTSPIFASNICNGNWQILLKPNFVDHFGTKFLSIYLRLVESDVPCMYVTASFKVCPRLDSDQVHTKGCGLNSYTQQTPCFGLNRFIEMYRLQKWKSGKFRFDVTLSICVPEGSIVPQIHPKLLVKERPLFDGKIIIGNGDSIPVDTKKLSCYSQIFANHFIGKSANPKPFDISYICTDRRIMWKICNFCYTGKISCSQSESRTVQLLQTAAALQMPLLMAKVQTQILEELSVESVPVAALLSRMGYLDPSAITAILNFIIKNFDKLKKGFRYKATFVKFEDYYLKHLIYGGDSPGVPDEDAVAQCWLPRR